MKPCLPAISENKINNDWHELMLQESVEDFCSLVLNGHDGTTLLGELAPGPVRSGISNQS